jgi:hypothetical protein
LQALAQSGRALAAGKLLLVRKAASVLIAVYTAATVSPAVIKFSFDPFLRLSEIVVRWETLAIALIIVGCVALAAVLAERMPALNQAYPEMGGKDPGAWHLRRNDLLFILLGVIPGTIVAGRLGFAVRSLAWEAAISEASRRPPRWQYQLGREHA